MTLAWESISANLQVLQTQEIDEAWFQSWSTSLERFSDLYIQALWDFSRDTKDADAKTRLDYVSQELKPECNRLSQALTSRAAAWHPQATHLARIVERMRKEVRFGIQEAIDIDREIDRVVQAYEEEVSKTLVDIGESVTLAKLRSLIRQEPDRQRRKELWEKMQAARLEHTQSVDETFWELTRLRQEKARLCGFETYLDFEWARQHRTYTPDDASKVLDHVRESFAPVIERKNALLSSRLDVNVLRPWDDILLIEEPKEAHSFTEEDYIRAVAGAYRQLSSNFGAAVDDIAAKRHLDLMSRPNKVSGDFSTVLCEANEGLVFCNGAGDVASLRVMLHETGHALHYQAAGKHNLYFERVAPVEIMEFVAYCLQFLTIERLAMSGELSVKEQELVKTFAGTVMLDVFETYDATERFQHWVYKQPKIPTSKELDTVWLEMRHTLGVDWSDHREILKKGWQHGHIIASPLYSIEYFVAYIGLLLFIENYRKDARRSIAGLEELLNVGQSKTVAESFAVASVTFPFTREAITRARLTFEREFLPATLQ